MRNNLITICLCTLIVLLVASGSYAQDIKPTYDLTGIWRSKDPGTQQIFQDGIDVKHTYIHRDFAHYMAGKYINPTTIKGIMYRTTRSSGCKTQASFTATATSANSFVWKWLGKDSNCDLREGQSGEHTYQRDSKLEAQTF